MLLVMSVLAVAAGGQAASDTATPAPQAVVAQAESGLQPGERKIKVVCKTRAPTGTRFAKKTCMELEAYRKQQDEDRRAFEEVQNRPVVSIARGN